MCTMAGAAARDLVRIGLTAFLRLERVTHTWRVRGGSVVSILVRGSCVEPYRLCVAGFLLVVSLIPKDAVTCSFDDADVLAVRISGELAGPAELVEQIRADLAAIRAQYPFLDGVHAGTKWQPCELFAELTPEAWDGLGDGTYTALDSLNQLYDVVEISTFFTCCYATFEFGTFYSPTHLSSIYRTAEGIVAVEPNWRGGDPGNDIMSAGSGDYLFRRAWGDCSSGCLEEHFWSFTVTDGAVVPTGEWGDPLAVQGRTWSYVKRIFRE